MGRCISYIIPTLNEEESLQETLDSIHIQLGEKEVIIADGGSNDKTLKIAQESGCKIIQGPPGRGSQLNKGADRAKGDFLLFLHADTTLPEGASTEILSLMNAPGTVAGSFHLTFKPSSKLLKLYSLCTSLNNSYFTFGDQGFFMYRSAFYALGKFNPYPILEDVDLQARLRTMGRFVKSKLAVTTSSRRFLKHGIIRQQLLNLSIVAGFEAGIDPQTLARLYSDVR